MTNSHDRLSDPRNFGPGLWSAIHTEAAAATTPERKKSFLDFIYRQTSMLKCQACRHHATKYLSENPPEDYLDLQDSEGRETGLFEWTWIFHNTVNRRLGKPEVSREEANQLFLQPDSSICYTNCGEDVEGISTRPTKPLSGSAMYGTLPLKQRETRYIPTYSDKNRLRNRFLPKNN